MVPMQTAEEAVEQLFELYADDVYRYARYVLQNSSEAEDVVQEVFMRAFRAWDSFRQDANPKTWLWSIMRHYIQDVFKKKRVETAHRLENVDIETLSVPFEQVVELEDMIGTLDPQMRQVFVLRTVQDLSVSDTARVLGWSEAKVKTTLHRAMKQLRMLIEEAQNPVSNHAKGGDRR